jgi:ubiquinone/menaquinone biosynthesis C-methylase UbiE
MKDEDFWNSQDIVAYFAGKPADPRIEAFLDQYETTLGKRALDLGCGGGRHSELLASRGFSVSSVDINPQMLAATKERLRRAKLPGDIREGSILHIPYHSDTFDVVVTTGVLHQAETTAEYDMAIAELNRVTKKHAFILLNIFTNKDWDNTYETVSKDGFSVRTKEGLLMTLLPREAFISLMKKHDFELIDDQGEDSKMENTGPRTVYRAFFQKS